jgi:signal transduction histidine kinase
MAEMRALLLELRPEYLLKIDLAEGMRQLVAAFKARKHGKVHLSAEDSIPIPPEVHVTFYRIAQEAINNIAKHAGARNVWVTLKRDGAGASLTVRDDGRGFQNGDFTSGMGMDTMRERSASIGAHFEVLSERGKGTTVQLSWGKA